MLYHESSCRICLSDGAIYHLFDSKYADDLNNKIVVSLNEKIEDIEGYPSKICIECKDTIEKIWDFRNKYQESRKILESQLPEVKTEYNNNYSDIESETEYFLELGKEPKLEPEVKVTEELLDSLNEITVKRVKPDHVQTSNNSALSKVTKNKRKTGKQTNKKVKKIPNSNKSLKKCANKSKLHDNVGDEKKQESVEGVKSKNKNLKEVSSKSPILCDICGATFKRPRYLESHKKKHNPRISFKCEKCPKTYQFKSSLHEHYQKTHDKVKNAICDTCGMAFYAKKGLSSHIKVVHEKIKAKPKLYKCRFCDKSYHYRRGIVVHERSAHTGERPEVCNVCNAAFYDIVYLREHMRLHTGDNPFKCPICYRGYAQRGNMKSHMRNHKISELHPDVLSELKPNYLKFLRPCDYEST